MGCGWILLGAIVGRLRTRGTFRGCRCPFTAGRAVTLLIVARATVPIIAWTALSARISLIPVSTVRRRMGRALALNLLGRTLKAAQLLAQRFDLPFVGGLLALGQFEQLQHFVELIQRLAKGRDDLHHFIDGLVDGFGFRGMRRARWGCGTLLARRLAGLLPGVGWLVGHFDFGRGRKELFVLPARFGASGFGLHRGFGIFRPDSFGFH